MLRTQAAGRARRPLRTITTLRNVQVSVLTFYTKATQVPQRQYLAYHGGGQSAQTTLYNYDTSERVWNVINPDGTASTNFFYLTGETEETFGARQYPVFNIFDYRALQKCQQGHEC